MIKSKGIFAVSFIAMMVAGGAYANIASQGYVDQQIDTRQVAGDYATNTALGTVRTTATNAQSAAAAAQTAADDAQDAADAAASAAATAQQTANAKVSTAQGSSAANKAVITNASGNITTGTISSAMITDGTITNADISASAAIAQSKISGLTTALAGKANTADVPTKTSDLTNDSGFITAEELPDGYTLPVATADTLGGVKSGGNITVGSDGAVTVNQAARATTATTATSATNATNATNDADGNEITETYATKSELTSGLSGKQATLSSAQLNAVNSGITSTKVSTYDGYNAKITAAQDAADDAAAAAAAAQSTASGKLSSISGSTGGTGNVVTSVSASGSTVSATKGITAEETKNKVTSVRAAASATDTAYPSEKAVATALAAKANTSALSGYATTSALGAVEDKAEAAQSAASAAQTAANAKVATAQGSGNANKAVITNSSGNITTGQIASGMIADDAVTSAKLAAGAVDATALASGAVTSAKIADGTITNADISASAAIAASKISGLSTVATTGSYDDLEDKPTIPSAYVLKAATSSALGGVKSGGDITVGTDGAVTVNSATKADSATTATTAASATKATQDASGNVITSTYATKSQITALDSTSTGTGAVVMGVSQTDGKVSVTKGNVKIPFGGQNATDYAAIWVE